MASARAAAVSRLWKSTAIRKQSQCLGEVSPLYAENCECVNCTRAGAEELDNRFGMLQVHLLIIATDNAITNHFGRPAFLRHLVAEERLLHAHATVGPMAAFEAGMQALMAMAAIAEAI